MVKVDASLIEADEPPLPPLIHYPESDGKPMGDNDWQREWIVKIIVNLQAIFAGRDDVYVSGDLFWYPVQGNNRIVQAPDALVAMGRPPGMRGCYKQWEEGDIAPQVVFEIYSPSNTAAEMLKRLQFYNRYGVEEYYVYDPQDYSLEVWQRQSGQLKEQAGVNGWVSPLLGIRFSLEEEGLVLYRPDGNRFLRPAEMEEQIEHYREQAEYQRAKAEYQREQTKFQRERADRESAEKDRERVEKERLAAKLRALGIDPEIAT